MSPKTSVSPMFQPGSPLSPRMDSLAMPSQQRRRPAPRRTQGSTGSSSLRLPSLPRFHPANFPSQSTSTATTPATAGDSPQPPMSPRAQQKQYSDAQRQLYVYQREVLAATAASRGAKTPTSTMKPTSPRLVPLGSPGPVTPLELEGQDGYLAAGACGIPAATGDLVDHLIRQEAQRRGEVSPKVPTSVS